MPENSQPSLLDDVAAERRVKGPLCTIAILLDTLAPADATDLRTLLGNRTIPGTAIARVLRKRGHTITDSTIQRHRNALCACPQ
jgi:hypothetical protein